MENKVYNRQLAVLMIFMTITYKIVMLPKYLSMGASRDFVLGGLAVMMVEMLMFVVVYGVIKNGNILDMYVRFGIIRCILLLVALSSMLKLIVLSVETLDYISSLLFREGRWLFIILTLFPALGYIAFKGVNTISRLSEIIVWAVGATVIFTLLFLRADMSIDNICPMLDNGVGIIAKTYFSHSMWFGDALPFLLITLVPPRNTLDKVSFPIGLVLSYVLTTAFFLLFIAIYGDVAPYIKYAFSNIGIYNSISSLLGGVDFPIISVWLLMAIVKLSFLLYSIVYSLEHFIKRAGNARLRAYIACVTTILYMLVLSFAVSGTDKMYEFATSWVRYIVLVIDYALPIIVLLISGYSRRKMQRIYLAHRLTNI